MDGEHSILIDTGKVKFNLTLDWNITVIIGDSATGKTYLCDTVHNYVKFGRSSGINVITDVKLDVGANTFEDAIRQLRNSSNTIIFYDSDIKYVMKSEFVEAVRDSSNYVVIMCREVMDDLLYSSKSVRHLATESINGTFVSSFI
jgi:predicted ATPase